MKATFSALLVFVLSAATIPTLASADEFSKTPDTNPDTVEHMRSVFPVEEAAKEAGIEAFSKAARGCLASSKKSGRKALRQMQLQITSIKEDESLLTVTVERFPSPRGHSHRSYEVSRTFAVAVYCGLESVAPQAVAVTVSKSDDQRY